MHLTALRSLAVSPGGIPPHLREQAWSLLLQVGRSAPDSEDAAETAFSHSYVRQLDLDVPRSFPEVPHWSQQQREDAEGRLKVILNSVLQQFHDDPATDFHYYQGLHAVAAVLMLVLGEAGAKPALARMIAGPLRGFCAPSMNVTMSLLGCIFPLLGTRDEKLMVGLQAVHGNAIFALPWVITWFTHVEHRVWRVAPLLDWMLGVGHPTAPIYLAAAMVLGAKRALENVLDDGELHVALRDVPSTASLQETLQVASGLYRDTPPTALLTMAPEEDQQLLQAQWPELWQCPPTWLATAVVAAKLPASVAAVLQDVRQAAGMHARSRSGDSVGSPTAKGKMQRTWRSPRPMQRVWGRRGGEGGAEDQNSADHAPPDSEPAPVDAQDSPASHSDEEEEGEERPVGYYSRAEVVAGQRAQDVLCHTRWGDARGSPFDPAPPSWWERALLTTQSALEDLGHVYTAVGWPTLQSAAQGASLFHDPPALVDLQVLQVRQSTTGVHSCAASEHSTESGLGLFLLGLVWVQICLFLAPLRAALILLQSTAMLLAIATLTLFALTAASAVFPLDQCAHSPAFGWLCALARDAEQGLAALPSLFGS